MPRNRLFRQIDDELVQARNSLKFWRDQAIILADTEFQTTAKRQIVHREAEIKRLLEAQEALIGTASV